MSPAQIELVRRHCRLGLAGVGLVFLLMFVRVSQSASTGHSVFVWISDEAQLVIGLGAALIVAFLSFSTGLRRRDEEPRPSWWRTDPALFAAVLAYGVGCGLFLVWCLEVWGDDEAGLAMTLLWFVGILALLPERGVRPAGAIFLAALAGGVAALARLAMGSRWSRYDDEVLACWLLGLFVLPLAYLLLRGLLNVVQTQEAGAGDDVEPVSLDLPVQIVARDGTYLVTLEAPGLADATGITTRIEGRTLHLVVPRPGPDPREEVLLSTRLRGQFPVAIQLPRTLQDPPWNVGVAHGLITVQVAPIGDA